MKRLDILGVLPGSASRGACFFLLVLFIGTTAAFNSPSKRLTNSNIQLRQSPSRQESRNIKDDMQSLYSSDELQNILDLHGTLSESIPSFIEGSSSEADVSIADVPDVQNLVLQTLDDVDGGIPRLPMDKNRTATTSPKLRFDSHLTLDDFQSILPKVRAIVSDVDGTLLSSRHTLHPSTKLAMKSALEAAFSPVHPLRYFFPATGKTRAGALHSLGPEMEALLQQVPGVFVQGLYCVDASGNVVFEKKLPTIAVEQAEVLAKQFDVSLVGYDGDTLCVSQDSKEKHAEECHFQYGEPMPIRLTRPVDEYKPGFHKILLMNDDPEVLSSTVRPKLEELAEKLDCVVTQAIPNMLELLPSGCSKAVGLEKLLENLGLEYSQVCAIG